MEPSWATILYMWLRTTFFCFELGCHCVPPTTTCNYWPDSAVPSLQLLPHPPASALGRGLYQAERPGPDTSSMDWCRSVMLRANTLCFELATFLLQSSGPVFLTWSLWCPWDGFVARFALRQNARTTEQIAWQNGDGEWFFYTMPLGCVFHGLGCWFVGVRGCEVCQKGWRSQIWHYS